MSIRDTQPSANRRAAPRLNIVLQVEGTAFGLGVTKNISSSGIYLELKAHTPAARENLPDVGEAIKIRFQLPGSDEKLEVRGHVVRFEHGDQENQVNGMGLEFTEMPPHVRDALDAFLKARLEPDES
jgi:Tfp pilus assembly protein PilZ